MQHPEQLFTADDGSPLVSVIVPSYNYARYLEERLESILSQSMQDFELILLDDCSSDGSADILRRYADHPKTAAVEINSRNSGSPFAQWLKGIGMARGKYVWIAEADDLALPDFLEKGCALLESNPGCSLAFSGSRCIDPEGNITGVDQDRWNEKRPRPAEGTAAIFPGETYIRRNLYWRSYIYNASGVLFRRSALSVDRLDLARRALTMRNSGDWLFWTVIASAGSVAEIYSRTNRFRIHPRSTTAQGSASGRRAREDMEVVDFIERHFHIGPFRRLIRHGALYKNIRRLNIPDADRKEILRQYAATFHPSPFAYAAERITKTLAGLLPFIPSERNDRL